MLNNPLIALGAGLLQSSGPSFTPIGVGQGVGRGLLMMQDALRKQEEAEERKARTGLLGKRFELEEMRFGAEQDALKRENAQRAAQQQAMTELLSMVPPEHQEVLSRIIAADRGAGLKQAQSLLLPETAELPPAVRTALWLAREATPKQRAEFFAARRAGAPNISLGGGPALGMAWTPDEVARLRAAGLDPAQVYPSGDNREPKAFPSQSVEAARKEQAGATVADINAKLERMESTNPALVEELTGTKRGVANAFLGDAARHLLSPDAKIYVDGMIEWATRELGYVSGANVPESELRRSITTYFPQPGDGPRVVESKRRRRRARERQLGAKRPGSELDRLREKYPSPGGSK